MNAFSVHNRAFINDARETTRPMTWDVNTLTEIDNSFDRIAYEKCKLHHFFLFIFLKI